MNSKRNKLINTLCLVPILGLISCSKDNSAQPVDYDMWEDAPVLSVVESSGSRTLSSGDATRVSSSDFIQITDPQTHQANSSQVTSVESQSTCTNNSGQTFERTARLQTKSTYKILDLLPQETLPPETESTDTYSNLQCTLGLRLTNSFGSTRNRKIQNLVVRFDLSDTQIKIVSVNSNSHSEHLSLTSEESFQTYINGVKGENSLYLLSCTDFQSTEQQTAMPILSDLAVRKEILINQVDPRKAHPKQTCRVYQRLSSSETFVSPKFILNYPIPELDIATHVAINERWHSAHMNQLSIVRTYLRNTQSFPTQVRIRKNVGSVTLSVVSTSADPFVTHNKLNREMILSVESNDLFHDANYFYLTIAPHSMVSAVYYINVNMGCGSDGTITGMDYSFSDESLFQIEQTNRPLSQDNMTSFASIKSYSLSLTNAERTSGANRERYYLPWINSQFSKVMMNGAPVLTDQSCWN